MKQNDNLSLEVDQRIWEILMLSSSRIDGFLFFCLPKALGQLNVLFWRIGIGEKSWIHPCSTEERCIAEAASINPNVETILGIAWLEKEVGRKAFLVGKSAVHVSNLIHHNGEEEHA